MAKLLSGTRIYGTATVDTQLFVSGTTSATSTTTGALQVVGGTGIQGDLYARNIYSNGVLIGTNAGSATTSTNLSGGYTGAVPYQLSPSITTFANGFFYNNGYLQVNSSTVLTTSSVIGQIGLAVTATSATISIGFLPGIQGLTADFGLIGDTTGAIIYDFGIL